MNNRAASALIGALIVIPLAGSSQESGGSTGAEPELTEITASAQRAYLDPDTGRLTDKPPPGVHVMTLSPQELNMLSTSHEGLVQRPHPSGWILIDLQGRFRHMAVATMADDGSVEVQEVAGEVFLPAKPRVSKFEEKENKK